MDHVNVLQQTPCAIDMDTHGIRGEGALDAAHRAWDDGRRRGEALAGWLERELGELSRRRVLDLGCAAGGISLGMAPHVGSVVGIDVSVREGARAAQRAAAAPPARRPVFANGSGVALPFRSASFDLVLLNGVLEYMGRALPTVLPRDAQLTCLREVARVLSRDGHVAIAIENRWYPPYLLRSPHQFVVGGLALPQRLAPVLTERLGGRRLWEALHGFRALCALVREAGFPRISGYLPVYGYHFPKAVVPVRDRRELWRVASRRVTGDGEALGALAAGGRWGPIWFRTIAALGLHTLLAPAFFVIGAKR
jgi:SAM-dependent methyltransferase